MVKAFAARRLGVQNRLILASVQMPPLAFWLMIVELAGRTALRAGPLDHVVMSEVDVDFTGFQFQIHGVDKPRSLHSENAPIELVILHPRHCRMPPAGSTDPLRTLNSQTSRTLLLLGMVTDYTKDTVSVFAEYQYLTRCQI